MSRSWLRLTCVAAVLSLSMAAAQQDQTGADSGSAELVLNSLPLEVGGPMPATAGSGGRPKLYDNTTVCTVTTQALPVGGSTNPGPALSLVDWFETGGGHVSGFDLYVLNGGTGAIVNHITELQFYQGTDEFNYGTPIQMPILARFRTVGAPTLSPIPVHRDPVTQRARVIKVSVDYDARRYYVTDAETGATLITEQNGPGSGQDIGADGPTAQRPSFDLNSGKVGVLLRFGGERSRCAANPPGNPVCGPVLAGGGVANADGMHIFNAESCNPAAFVLLCDDGGWGPTTVIPCTADSECAHILGATCDLDEEECTLPERVPCTGGDVCNLDLPYYGIALTLYIGPGDGGGDGNNDRPTADTLSVGAPAPCNGGVTSVRGFVGDNATPYSGTPDVFFDADNDGDRDVLDWGSFQRCFGATLSILNPGDPCRIHDHNNDLQVNAVDYGVFQDCRANPALPICAGNILNAPDLLQDIDMYRVTGLTAGRVVSALLEGEKSPINGPTWDPFLRIYALQANTLVPLASSDDYERSSLDAFTTVVVPASVNTLYVAVSAAANQNYNPEMGSSIIPIAGDEAGGYVLSVAVSHPGCVTDTVNPSCPAPPTLCTNCAQFASEHEPDDTLADADARGTVANLVIRGMLGDGAFAGIGQDLDIYRLQFTGPTANTRSFTARVMNLAGGGFPTVFDTLLAVYNVDGELIATADQSSLVQLDGNDQSRPGLGVNVCGTGVNPCTTNASLNGVYYLAIFGSDRGLYTARCENAGGDLEFRSPAIAPTALNFPHGINVAGTQDSDLRPTVGGRVNRSGMRLEGCDPDPANPPPAPTQQCYRINVSTFTSNLGLTATSDLCEVQGPDGDDSIPDACDDLGTADRLSMGGALERFLGNGHYGGFQGDVDFYAITADPGDIIAINVADDQQPPSSDHPVRSYLALYGSDGNPFAYQDFTLERANEAAIDGTSDEIASILAAVMPDDIGSNAYVMVGIDNGNLLSSENRPFDAFFPGTTLSRRFETGIWQARRYNIAAAVVNPVASAPGNPRMFIVPLRGVDNDHLNCYIEDGSNADGLPECYPPLLEIDPVTGAGRKLLPGEPFFATYRRMSATLADPDDKITDNPILAYDGTNLFVSAEVCGGDMFCAANGITHPLFRLNPNLNPGQSGYITTLGTIEGLPTATVITGLTEIGGRLFALDTTHNQLRWWNKAMNPTAGNGGVLPIMAPAAEFNDVDGDLGTNGTSIYVKCLTGTSVEGICRFTANFADPLNPTLAFNEILPDPITNEALIPGPRLGGIDVLPGGIIVASDANGSLIQHFNPATNSVTGFALPREFVAARLTVRAQAAEQE